MSEGTKPRLYIATDFGFRQTLKGEQIVALHEVNGIIYLFTPKTMYIVRKQRWYERVWRKFVKLFVREAQDGD